MIKGILVDVSKRSISVLEIEDTLEQYYKILNCNCIDIVPRRIGSILCRVICDDEGRLKENQIVSAINVDVNIEFVGNIFIVGYDVIGGELTSLEDEFIDYIIKFMKLDVIEKATNIKYPIIMGFC